MSSSIMNQIIQELRLPTHNPVQNTPKHGRRAAIVRAAKKAKTTISTIKNDGKVNFKFHACLIVLWMSG
ncbi:hypothetical protein ACO0RG_001923 [Hanseniaspora osmophila]